MPRALWKGAITFGLVYIPVELYPAEKRDTLDLTMLDRRDMKPVGYQRINKESGEVVPWEEIVKGYEYEKDQYAVLSDEDFRKAKELSMALKLMEEMTEEWNPDKYRDTYRDDILARVKEKIKAGQTEVITEAEETREAPRKAEVIDLMSLLKSSIDKKKRKGVETPAEGKQRFRRRAVIKPDRSKTRPAASPWSERRKRA
jgi:non-homologous end joining protein Ku